jgi:hypothetical protein
MYYEDPSDEALYGLDSQYLFGPDMIISPISKRSDWDAEKVKFEQALGAVTWTTYAPKPRNGVGWVDRVNGDFVSSRNVTSNYGIHDVPGFERQGAVVPMRPRKRGESSLNRAVQTLTSIEFRISPAEAFYNGGSISGTGVVIDDDGLTTEYLDKKFATTKLDYSFEGRTFKISLSQVGDFPGRPLTANVQLSFPQLPPIIVTSTGPKLDSTSYYDHKLLGSVISFSEVDLKAGAAFELAIDSSYTSKALQGLVGARGFMKRARYAKDAMDDANTNYGPDRANITTVALAGTVMSPDFAEQLPQLWQAAQAQAKDLLQNDQGLKSDIRRARFVSDIMLLQPSQRYVLTDMVALTESLLPVLI